jgi:hypothetical protein
LAARSAKFGRRLHAFAANDNPSAEQLPDTRTEATFIAQ